MQSRKKNPHDDYTSVPLPSQGRPSPRADPALAPLPVSPGANVVKIVNAAPNLLSYDIEASLGVKIGKLAELLPGADIVKLIQYAPTLLYHDTANSIAPKLRCATPGQMATHAPPTPTCTFTPCTSGAQTSRL